MKGVRDMKKWLLYILSVVLCTGLFSCTAYEEMDDIPSAGKGGEVKVSFVLNIPSSRSTTGGSDLDDNYYWERYINETDIRAFVFINNKYQEEVKGLYIDPVSNEQNQIRKITGMISNQYEGRKVQLVVLTNMASRGVEPFTLTPGMSQKDLYEKLVYKYNEAWTFSEAETESYIPMWGISGEFSIKPDVLNDAGEIYMYRAIAKIDIKVNDGNGIEGFVITKIELCNVADQGYCASLKTPSTNDRQFESASCPDNMEGHSEALTVYTCSDNEQTKLIENKIYVPEMAAYNPIPVFYIKLYVNVSGYEQQYNIYMREEQANSLTAFDLVRNHKYIFNINSFTPKGTIKLNYEVSTWGQSEVFIPEFD